MKNFNFLTLFILITSLFSCNKSFEFTTSQVSITNIKPNNQVLFYSLPKTSIKVNIYYSRQEHIAGPYAEYARQFLGLNNTKVQNETIWKIDSSQIETFNESDPEMIFAIQSSSAFPKQKILDISNEGYIYNPQNFIFNLKNIEYVQNTSSISFTDFGPIPSQAEKFDTTYKIVLKDSMFVRIPIVKPRLENKTPQEKAKEIADIIYKLRQRKLELLLEEDIKNLESTNLKRVIEEISSIEDAYLTLFIGKQHKQSFKESFIISPTADYNKAYDALCFFSPNTGIRKTGSPDSKPVLLILERTNKTGAIKTLLSNQKLECRNQLIYRIPEISNISITFNGETIRLSKTSISQFGAIVSCLQQ